MPATQAVKHVPSYTISVGGVPIAREQADRVREVRVISSLASADVCTVTVLYDKPRKVGEAQPIDEMPFDIGKELAVRLGRKDARAPQRLFVGDIVTVEPQFGSGGVQLTVRAFDKAHKLFRGRKVRAFQNQTVSDIVSKVCGDAGVPVQTEASGGPLEFMLQQNETDGDFIARLADRIGFEFVVIEGKARFRRPSTKGDVVELTYPTSLFQFNPRVTAVQQVDSVEVRSFDPKTKSLITSTKSRPEVVPDIGLKRDTAKAFKGDKMLVATEPVATSEEAGATAQSLLNRMANTYAQADGLTEGDPRVRAGAVIDVKGVGQKFGGRYRIYTSTHTLRGGGVYETRFTSAPAYTIGGTVASAGGATSPRGPASFTGHLAIGVVTNNRDKDGLGRVKLKFPALSDDQEGTWARIAVPSAGAERGLMMLPVVGEEVVVGFEHGDVTRPYVLGSLFNGKDKPGTVLAAPDGSFGLRSDKQIVAHSKLATDVSSDDVLKLQSTKQLSLDTQDALTATATKGVKVQAGQQLEAVGMQGVKISTNGAQLKIEAPAGMVEISAANLRLSATGMVQISGSQIMLG